MVDIKADIETKAHDLEMVALNRSESALLFYRMSWRYWVLPVILAALVGHWL
jgi:hypothetical protein